MTNIAGVSISDSSGYIHLGIEFLDHMVILCLAFWGTLEWFSCGFCGILKCRIMLLTNK